MKSPERREASFRKQKRRGREQDEEQDEARCWRHGRRAAAGQARCAVGTDDHNEALTAATVGTGAAMTGRVA